MIEDLLLDSTFTSWSEHLCDLSEDVLGHVGISVKQP